VNNTKFNVVVVGGGFSGTMLAIHLLRRAPTVRVALIDKGSLPGRGLLTAPKPDFIC
jgi:flavin-dependent dehydrogenase